jgi:hypothetical protein
MIFFLFAVLIAAAFFVSSMFLLNYGRQLGLRYLQKDAGTMTGLTTVEGAVFALMGLLLAFTISGALQRFDERRQLVIQEANAASTAHDRLALFEGEVARDLQNKLRDYFQARIDLYRMPHDYSLLKRTEYFSDNQEDKILRAKNELWNAAVGACPQSSFRPACGQALPVLANLFEVARLRLGAAEKHPPQIIYVILFGLGLGGSLLAGFGMAAAKSRSWIHMLIFATTLTVALYTLTDMEYPRSDSFALRISIISLSTLTSKCKRRTARGQPRRRKCKSHANGGAHNQHRSFSHVIQMERARNSPGDLGCRKPHDE